MPLAKKPLLAYFLNANQIFFLKYKALEAFSYHAVFRLKV